MKFINNCISLCTVVIFISSCGASKENSKYQLSNGFYKSTLFSNKDKTVYVDNGEDVIAIYQSAKNATQVDTLQNSKMNFPQLVSKVSLISSSFSQHSFDIDFLTIPFKYRPGVKDFPNQFNTNLNGAVYIGYRNDIYQLKYKKTALNTYQRLTRHYGFSFGLLSGLGGTAINPFVTMNPATPEYDGVVWLKGIAGIIGINNFTIGLALGYDDLLDNNKRNWIYQRKPWIGLVFGLNLN